MVNCPRCGEEMEESNHDKESGLCAECVMGIRESIAHGEVEYVWRPHDSGEAEYITDSHRHSKKDPGAAP